MRQIMSSSLTHGAPGRARVLCFAGAKGGVGTTTIATHLALDLRRTLPTARVLLVDLDLEKGDVHAAIEVRHRASIADVAKVSADLSARAVADAVVVHESGLHLLLTPHDVRDIEAVNPRTLREVVAVLRQEYDFVVVDAGSHVTPVQATAVELADEVVIVTTPDVLALRGLKRSIAMWEGLAVRKEADVRVLVNRVSRQTSVSAEAVGQLTRAPVMSVAIPAMFRRLEPAMNARDPLVVREGVWWRALRSVAVELGTQRSPSGTLERPVARPDGMPVDAPAATTAQGSGERSSRWRRRRRGGSDAGSASLELVTILPLTLLILLLCWQVAIYGMAAVVVGHAATAAARAASVGADPAAAALGSLPSGFANRVSVSSGGSTVTVAFDVPLVAPGVASLPVRVSSTEGVIREP
jgi:pilus assembly protein CpaE